ncbi:MAG: hypothetical protein PHV82_00005 [Victivallaceae bacterium]|nr:hypothetical protein [Victivallaceae bacterium]
MKIISPDILDAVHRMKLQLGTNIEVAKRLGVSSKHVGKILAEDVKYFEDKTWTRIKPLLSPYIKLSRSSDLNLSEEEKEIIKYLRRPENRRQVLQLLLKIEEYKDQYYGNSLNERHEVNEAGSEFQIVAEECSPITKRTVKSINKIPNKALEA